MKVFLALLFVLFPLCADEPVRYEIRFPNAVHHEAEITVKFSAIPVKPLEVLMSRASPGRYALHEFAKNVYRVRATDGNGKELAVIRSSPHQWNIPEHDGTVTVSYTLFGDRADGTYTAIDLSHAHLNLPATFMWARGLAGRPIHIEFVPPNGLNWRVATQLKPTADERVFEAPDLDYFFDSPAELSDFELREWKVNDGKRTQIIRLALHHEGTPDEADSYAMMAETVVLEQIGVFGELPEFDYGTYTFLADYVPWARGDGMEHRNSTYCTSSRGLRDSADRLIGTLAHEFLHIWNVERLRPASLEPFDFERENLSRELWFAEGFTSYYGPLTMHRAGLIDIDRFAESLGSNLNQVLRSPGLRFVSPVEASMEAPFADGATSNEPVNRRNTFISYYGYGAAVGLGLDLTLRTRPSPTTLDDYMRALWDKFGRPEKPYTMNDLERVLGEVSGDQQFASEYFSRHIYGREVVEYAGLFEKVGFVLRETGKARASLGSMTFAPQKNGAVVQNGTLIGTPLYEAGLDGGARILSIDGKKIRNKRGLDRILQKRDPGDTVVLDYEQRGRSGSVKVELASPNGLELIPFERAGRKLTPEISALRREWLGSKAR